LSCRAKSPAAP
jgi:hypothetical protein